MAKNKITSSFVIGLFVMIGVALSVIAALWFANDKMDKESTQYVTFFNSSVDGLSIGSAVKYQGLKTGNVAEITIAPHGKLIKVLMDIDPKLKISNGMRSQVTMSGIAGGKFIQLYYPKSEDVLAQHPTISFPLNYKRIKSAPSEIEEISAAGRDVMNRLSRIEYFKISQKMQNMLDTTTIFLNNVNNLLMNDNIVKSLENLELATANINDYIMHLQSLTVYNDLEIVSKNMINITKDIALIAKNVNTQILEMNLPHYTENIFMKLDTTAINVNNTILSLNYQSVNLIRNLNEVVADFKTTNIALRRSLSAFSEQPTHTLFSKPPKKEK